MAKQSRADRESPQQEHASRAGEDDLALEAIWDSAETVGIGFRAGSSLYALLLRHVTRARLPVRTQASWATSATKIEVVGATALACEQTDFDRSELLAVAEVVVLASLRRGRVDVSAFGPNEEVTGEVMARLHEAFPALDGEERQEVGFQFSWLEDSGVRWMSRNLAVPRWSEIASNYGVATRRRLETLVGGPPPARSGQTMIWHGPPGTGKTSAVRALAWEWRKQCDVHVVADPDQLFGRASGYLLEVVGNPPPGSGKQHRLVVLEDAGELLSVGARSEVGQGLSRFLNVCDGLLGQAQQLTLLVTTNEPLRRLHPAVSRAGRCAAEVEFAPLSIREANRWLRRRSASRVSSPRVIADLYALVEGRPAGARLADRPIGFGAALAP